MRNDVVSQSHRSKITIFQRSSGSRRSYKTNSMSRVTNNRSHEIQPASLPRQPAEDNGVELKMRRMETMPVVILWGWNTGPAGGPLVKPICTSDALTIPRTADNFTGLYLRCCCLHQTALWLPQLVYVFSSFP